MKRTIVPPKERNEKTVKYIAILNYLAKYPYDSFSLTDLANKVEVSKSTVNRILVQMKHESVVLVGSVANVLRIRFNAENSSALGYKIGTNLKSLYSSGIIEFIRQNFPDAKSIVLFGSFRKGEDGQGSDIDIAIEVIGNRELEILELNMVSPKQVQALESWERKAERKFKLHVFSRNRIDRNLFINIANGIVVSGLLEVNP